MARACITGGGGTAPYFVNISSNGRSETVAVCTDLGNAVKIAALINDKLAREEGVDEPAHDSGGANCFSAKFGLRDRVIIDGDITDIDNPLVAVITEVLFQESRVLYLCSYFRGGDSKSVYVEEFRLSLAR